MGSSPAGRPKKVRYIQRMPQVVLFSPRGKPGRPEQVDLGLDQFEALKLADFQGFSQSQGAVAMHVSRPSFGRLLREARKVVADAIINGKILRIGMGDAQVGIRKSEYTKDSIKEELLRFRERTRKVAGDLSLLPGTVTAEKGDVSFLGGASGPAEPSV